MFCGFDYKCGITQERNMFMTKPLNSAWSYLILSNSCLFTSSTAVW